MLCLSLLLAYYNNIKYMQSKKKPEFVSDVSDKAKKCCNTTISESGFNYVSCGSTVKTE